ncbi:hypothetical protein [Ferrimonas balearica]|uniref:hypothetical protein n=1 Tax=Ferrimonas balearica TaxID=44012 RepID=UPI001C9915D9|nr:hypothetical protein [Ferrimonas balearica]MBY5920182.1 hypothetical protein [Ferrimonas balearica]MBY5997133.1 hypothetical protein [Ferrimonas balearica]
MTFTDLDIAVTLTPLMESDSDEANAMGGDPDACISLSLKSVIECADNWPGLIQLPHRLSA